MEELIPLFPLKLVAFPGEKLNLHIFEPRYKELVTDILAGDRRFGIPAYLNNRIEFGTLMEILEVTKTYPDGRMDIRNSGIRVFKVLDYNNPFGDKMYSAGNVRFVEDHNEEDPFMKSYLLEKLEEFYRLLQHGKIKEIDRDIISYDIIHHLGLSLEEEYKLLCMNREIDRQEFITEYLDRTIPVLKRTEKAHEIIKLNGHFKYLDPIDF